MKKKEKFINNEKDGFFRKTDKENVCLFILS